MRDQILGDAPRFFGCWNAQATLFSIVLVTVVLSAAVFAAETAHAGTEVVPGPQWDAAEAQIRRMTAANPASLFRVADQAG